MDVVILTLGPVDAILPTHTTAGALSKFYVFVFCFGFLSILLHETIKFSAGS